MEQIIDGDEKLEILDKLLQEEAEDITLESTVKCLHCGRFYPAYNLTVVKENENYYVYCAFHPKCSGSIIDIYDNDELFFQGQ